LSSLAAAGSSLPLCRHFGVCGGCAVQDLPAEDYRNFKRNLIAEALARYGLGDSVIEDVVPVPPRSRRRATFKVAKRDGRTELGFHAAGSHAIVDMRECLVLTPELFNVAQGLRQMMAALLQDGEGAELYAVEADNGFDLAIAWKRRPTSNAIAGIAHWAPKLGVVRVTANGELLYRAASPEIALGRARVPLPARAFLQPTRAGELMLQQRVLETVGKARAVVDLFAGCGTFTLPLAERARVHAVDSDAPMLEALADGARATPGLKPISTEKRDLFRRPLEPKELDRFDAAVLDPPRAGALSQAKTLNLSGIKRIAYVSCDAASFARDARALTDGGFRLDRVLGVDQFLWSAHIELVASFARD
jgi:23S rRNA (uracil1939-C5)-methyltransferase